LVRVVVENLTTITLASSRTIACGPVSGARSSRSARVFSIELICSRIRVHVVAMDQPNLCVGGEVTAAGESRA
jgi:hypothetical protein